MGRTLQGVCTCVCAVWVGNFIFGAVTGSHSTDLFAEWGVLCKACVCVCVLCKSAILFLGPQQGAIAQTSSLNGEYIARRAHVWALCEKAGQNTWLQQGHGVPQRVQLWCYQAGLAKSWGACVVVCLRADLYDDVMYNEVHALLSACVQICMTMPCIMGCMRCCLPACRSVWRCHVEWGACVAVCLRACRSVWRCHVECLSCKAGMRNTILEPSSEGLWFRSVFLFWVIRNLYILHRIHRTERL